MTYLFNKKDARMSVFRNCVFEAAQLYWLIAYNMLI